jgi:hypothetical protein
LIFLYSEGVVVSLIAGDYNGPRELVSYAKAAVQYGRRLEALLPGISSALN